MRRAFTLIEILVVITVIAVVIAITLPVIGNVRYSAKMTECSSNLRQVGIGVQAFAADNNGDFPRRKVAESVQPRKKMVAYQGTGPAADDRTVFAAYFTLDMLQCPFSAFASATTLEDSTANVVHGSYELYFGSAIDRSQGSSYLGNGAGHAYTQDLITGETFQLQILAADADWDYSSINQWHASHPDRNGSEMYLWKADNATRTNATWVSTNGTRGLIDRNFLYLDGSVQRRDNLSTNEPGMARIPAINNAVTQAVYHYLPME